MLIFVCSTSLSTFLYSCWFCVSSKVYYLLTRGLVVDNALDYNPGVAGSIPRSSGLSDKTLNRGPVYV